MWVVCFFFVFGGFGISCWMYVRFLSSIPSSVYGVLWFIGTGVSSNGGLLLSGRVG